MRESRVVKVRLLRVEMRIGGVEFDTGNFGIFWALRDESFSYAESRVFGMLCVVDSEHNLSEARSISVLRMGWETSTPLGRPILSHWTTLVSINTFIKMPKTRLFRRKICNEIYRVFKFLAGLNSARMCL